ncbi:MAG: hypothetical protein IPP73_14705 [Chitinophagaceae bacterium]|nr:hypothetical protein [Chitinophagaceae bacterium]
MKTGKRLLYESYSLHADLTVSEIIDRINKNILPRNAWKRRKEFPDMKRHYQGYSSADSFVISKITGYRKEIFHPVIKGNISSNGDKSIINVQMQPSLPARIGLFAWLFVMGFACLAILFLAITHPERIVFNIKSLILAVPFLAFALVCYMALSEFKSECRKSKQFLTTLLNGKEVSHSQY